MGRFKLAQNTPLRKVDNSSNDRYQDLCNFAVLGHKPGRGKTITIILVMAHSLLRIMKHPDFGTINPIHGRMFSFLITCPKSCVLQWEKKIKEWLVIDEDDIFVVENPFIQDDVDTEECYRFLSAKIVIMSRSQVALQRPNSILYKKCFTWMFVDEAHQDVSFDTSTNENTEVTRAHAKIAKSNPHIFSVLVTASFAGTNDPLSMQGMCSSVNAFPMKLTKAETWCSKTGKTGKTGDVIDSRTIKKDAVDFYRTRIHYKGGKDTIGQTIVYKSRILHNPGVTTAGMEKYNNLLKRAQSTGGNKKMLMQLFNKMRSILVAAGPFYKELLQLVGDLFDKRHTKIVIADESTRILEMAMQLIKTNFDEKFEKILIYTGRISNVQERASIVNTFLTAKSGVLFLSNAGGSGLDLILPGSSNNPTALILLKEYMSPARSIQMLHRIYRKGVTQPVEIWRLRIKGSLDDICLQINKDKHAIEKLVTNEEEWKDDTDVKQWRTQGSYANAMKLFDVDTGKLTVTRIATSDTEDGDSSSDDYSECFDSEESDSGKKRKRV